MPIRTRALLSTAPAVIAATVVAGLLAPASALAATPAVGDCHQSDLYVNLGNPAAALERYSVGADGAATLTSSVKLSEQYGDIALSADGSTLYGITFDSASRVHRINQSTGAVESEVPVAFADGSPFDGINALSVNAEGDLYAAAFGSDQIAVIDPDTGQARRISSFPAPSSGENLTSAGDFLTLDDGTVLGIGLGRLHNYLVVFDFAAGTKTIVGTIPSALGAAQSGGRIYLAGVDGTLSSIDELPRTASEAPVATTVRARTETGRPFYGATSSQDSVGCQDPVLDVEKALTGHADTDRSGSVTAGDVLSYRVVGTNNGNTSLSDVVIFDTLTKAEKKCDRLEVGESCELLTDYVVTDADADRGTVDNVGVAESDQTILSSASVSTAVSRKTPPLSDDEPQKEVPAPASGTPQAETPNQPQKSPGAGEKEGAAVAALAETGAVAPLGWAILAAVLLAAGAALRARLVLRRGTTE